MWAMKVRAVGLLWILLSCCAVSVVAEPAVLVGVMNKGNTEATLHAWQPTIDYLEKKINRKFVLIPLDFNQIKNVVDADAADFLLVQPATYVELETSYGISPIATIKARGIDTPNSTTQFGSVIFTRANNSLIKSITDLHGKKFAAMDPRSLGGWHIALGEFKRAGLVQKDIAKISFMNSHEAVVDSVLKGTADAGTVRTGVLESMAMQGQLRLSDIRLLENPNFDSTRAKNFPFIYNTRLYPEWPLVKAKKTSDQLAVQVALALIQMSKDDEAARAANIEGWVTPLNYQPVHDLLRELKFEPYDREGSFYNVAADYWGLFVLGLALMFGMAGVTIYVLRLNRNLTQTKIALERKAVEQQHAEVILRQSEERFRNLVETTHDIVWEVDREGVYRYISPQINEILGYTPEELINKKPDDLSVVESLHYRGKNLNEAFARFERFAGREHMWWDKAKSRRVLESSAVPYFDMERRFSGFRGITRDITSRKITEEALFEEKERLHVTLESIADGVVTMGRDGSINYINPSACQLTGWQPEQARGKSLLQVLDLVVDEKDASVSDTIARCLEKGSFFRYSDNTRLRQRDTLNESQVEVRISPLRNRSRQIIGVVVIFHDVTELHNLSSKMAYQATHDALTGLINRVAFEHHLQQAIESAHNVGQRHVICYLDLDQFKLVNDTCGHIAGDELLRQLAQEMQSQLRPGDVLARLGGDEFGVLLMDCSLPQAREYMERIRQMVKNFRFFWQEKGFEIGVSIGVVPISAESGTLTEVLSAADSACYVAKDCGRNRIHVSELDDIAVAERQGQMQWVHRIRRSLEDNRLFLHYQAITPLAGNAEGSYGELLLRMQDRQGNVVTPTDFIPAAERYHLMVDIDRWVVKHALDVLKTMDRRGSGRFAINLSGQSLCDDRFLDYILEKIKASGVSPERICLEITETAAIANLARAKKFIAVLKAMGCKFSLDDFGSGLSSFGYLKSLAVDFVKIDGRFVQNILMDPVSLAMVESINHIAHLMGLKTVAECVENQEVLRELKILGIDYVQGNGVHISLPLQEMVAASHEMQKHSRLALH